MRDDRAAALGPGVIAGVIGYGVFVVYFAASNIAAGLSPFHTAHLLGAALFGLSDAATVQAATVIAYNGLHLVAAIAIGILTSLLALAVDLHPALWYIVIFLFVAGLLYSIAIGGIVATEIAGAVTWNDVVIVNVLAGLFAGFYLFQAHPRLRERVRRIGD